MKHLKQFLLFLVLAVLSSSGAWATEINTVQSYYTLDGRKLNGKPSKAGLYIVNGKKVAIK